MLPVPFVIALAAFVVMLVFVRGSAFGLFVEAVGNNPVASRNKWGQRDGCPTDVLRRLFVAGRRRGADHDRGHQGGDVNNTGVYMELDAILAVAIGGTSLAGGRFYLVGSALGAIVIQTLTTSILARGVAPETTLVAKSGIIVALCLLQSPKFRAMFLVRRRGGEA
jgi:simple sugar transport system permease protein